MTQRIEDPQANDPLAALLREEAAGPEPTDATLDRVWTGVGTAISSGAPAPALGTEPLLAGASGSGIGKWLLAVVLVGGGAATAVAVSQPTAPAAMVQPAFAAIDPVRHASNGSAQRVAPPAKPLATPDTTAPAHQPAAPLRVVERSRTTPRPAKPKPKPATISPSIASTPPPRGLPEELRLLKRISSALKRKNLGEARKLVAQHDREFPKGALLEEREAARIRIACLSGQRSEGLRLRTAFAKRWPRSIHLPVMDTACAE